MVKVPSAPNMSLLYWTWPLAPWSSVAIFAPSAVPAERVIPSATLLHRLSFLCRLLLQFLDPCHERVLALSTQSYLDLKSPNALEQFRLGQGDVASHGSVGSSPSACKCPC